MQRVAILTALLLLAGCGGLPKPTGNESGGVIKWFATNEKEVFEAATLHCQKYGKRSHIKNIQAEAGGYAYFDCI